MPWDTEAGEQKQNLNQFFKIPIIENISKMLVGTEISCFLKVGPLWVLHMLIFVVYLQNAAVYGEFLEFIWPLTLPLPLPCYKIIILRDISSSLGNAASEF